MRLALRGIPNETANEIRTLAKEADCTLGQVVTLCVEIALNEARRQLLQASRSKLNADDLYSLQSIMVELCHPLPLEK